jgi:hypothetical protein
MEDEVIQCLLNYFQRCDTRFILETTELMVKLRRTLCYIANQYAVSKIGVGETVVSQTLLEHVEMVMSNVSYDKESQSLLSTTYVNLAHIYKGA